MGSVAIKNIFTCCFPYHVLENYKKDKKIIEVEKQHALAMHCVVYICQAH